MNHRTYNWKTASVIKETEDTVTIIFDTNGESFTYRPGQFLNARLNVGEEVLSRSYSISSCPVEDENPSITIKKVDGGKMSNYILRHADTIQQWEIDGPHGSFHTNSSSNDEKAIVLIGGGSGITPLYSILKASLKLSNAPVILFNCNRTWNDVVFAKAITKLEEEYGHKLQVFHFLSREPGSVDLPCKNYRNEKLSKLVLKKTLKKLLSEKISEAKYFLCGPIGLINLSKEALEALEIPAAQIHTEHFSPIDDQKSTIELPLTVKKVRLEFSEQTMLLEVQPGKSILESALEKEIPVSHSCKSGTCGKCAARQSAGKLHMMKNYALTDEELNLGYVLLCQSHPLNDEVIINIGQK